MAEVSNPHDRFFKEVFSRPEVAEDFIFQFLPADVSGLLRPGSFVLSKGSFVDANLKEHFSDLLYQVDFKEGPQGFVYILFEHKSYADPDVALQLLRYMTRIWDHVPNRPAGSLPAIIPVVLYHGSEKWKVPLNFASLYQAPASLRGNLCDFIYYLCDLSAYSDEEIKAGAMLRAALLLLKHVRSQDLAKRLTEIIGLLRAMNEQTALGFLETVLRYLGTAAAETVTMDECRKAVEATFSETGERFMERWTEQLVAERHQEWLRQGIEEGEKKGKQEGSASLTIRQLTRKFGGLDASLEDRIRDLTLDQLEKLGEDLLDFRDASALTEWLDKTEKFQ